MILLGAVRAEPAGVYRAAAAASRQARLDLRRRGRRRADRSRHEGQRRSTITRSALLTMTRRRSGSDSMASRWWAPALNCRESSRYRPRRSAAGHSPCGTGGDPGCHPRRSSSSRCPIKTLPKMRDILDGKTDFRRSEISRWRTCCRARRSASIRTAETPDRRSPRDGDWRRRLDRASCCRQISRLQPASLVMFERTRTVSTRFA